MQIEVSKEELELILNCLYESYVEGKGDNILHNRLEQEYLKQ